MSSPLAATSEAIKIFTDPYLNNLSRLNLLFCSISPCKTTFFIFNRSETLEAYILVFVNIMVLPSLDLFLIKCLKANILSRDSTSTISCLIVVGDFDSIYSVNFITTLWSFINFLVKSATYLFIVAEKQRTWYFCLHCYLAVLKMLSIWSLKPISNIKSA